MDVVNLVVMGKTGAGKSTLINSVLEEDLAPTGSGQAVTRENCVYSRKMLVSVKREALKNADYSQVAKEVKMYDTVGLEIDSAITQSTLKEIEELIRKAQNRERENDVTLVWFCVNWRSSRFEDYEVQLIRSMSVENEIPFVLVLTQCYANEESELEEQIRREFSEIPVVRVLAKDYSLRNGVIEAYGVKELLARSVSDYNSCKVRILEDKLQRLTRNRENTIDRIRVLGNSCIASHSQKAKKIGRIPVGCIPFVHGLCIEMITELNRIARLNSSKRFAQQLFENAVVAAIVTPAMIFPILSAAAAPAYIETVGETYLDSLIDAISCSTNKDLQDSDLMAARIKAEIKKERNEGKMMDTYTNEQKIRMKEEELGKRVDSLDRDSLPTANIMVAGGTGVGKSTLLNAIFDADLAATGTGKPVTDHINEYQNPEIPIHIWDTVGLELDSEKTKESISSIRQTIAERADLENQFDRIHAIWYCINSSSNRYQSAELEFIKNLYSIGVPFIIVLTQCIGDESEVNAFEAQIRKINETEGMNDIDIVQVCAREFKMRGVPPIAAFGLDDLVNVTLKKLPDFIKGGFIAAQKVSEAQKRQLCEDIIYEYVQAAKEGFWDKIPLANVFSANRRIINMFTKIGAAYNTVISENSVNKIKKECNIDFENAFWGLISPIDMGYGKKVTALLETKKTEGFEVKFSSFNRSEKVARMVAFYGYVFISSIEELWKKLTEEQLKDVELVADNLIRIINQKLEDRRTKKSKE